jgi:hypothetical protein
MFLEVCIVGKLFLGYSDHLESKFLQIVKYFLTNVIMYWSKRVNLKNV